MYIDREYFERLRFIINEKPWRVTDEDLRDLLHFTESLAIEYEQLKKEQSKFISDRITHTEMLKQQLIVSMLHKGKLNETSKKE